MMRVIETNSNSDVVMLTSRATIAIITIVTITGVMTTIATNVINTK